MAGRPPLRIGEHGKIKRIPVESGVWIARCRYRDTDGVTRIVERRSPTTDQHGKKAEDELLASFTGRQPPGYGDINRATKVVDLVTAHMERTRARGEWADRTADTYTYTAGKLAKLIGGLRVEEATAPRMDAALTSMRTAHGPGMAKQSKTLLFGALQLAVMSNVLMANPIRSVTPTRNTGQQTGAKPIDSTVLAELVVKLQASETCQQKDLVDPILLLIATGLRRSELLGLRWANYQKDKGTVTVNGKLVRVKGQGLKRVDTTKTTAGRRTLELPQFARDMLDARKHKDYYGSQEMIFPSTAGTWRDPDNFNKDWRSAREALGVPDITSHSFRKGVATLGDEQGLSARVMADQLGHAKISITQNTYMARGRVHSELATAIQNAVVPTAVIADE